MLNSKSFLAVDFGAVNVKLAEFETNDDGGLLLRQYGFKSLGQEGTQEASREAVMLRGLQELFSEKPYRSKYINVCAPGFHTFSKFVKLPPVDTSKVTQIIQYEAQQNVPFPLEEVVWDYQILGATATGELEVLLVAIKSDIVEGIFKVAEHAGLRMQLVDVSPAALCNAFRYNYGDLDGCTMLLDIGAKTSNLLFFEKGSVYSRGINIGANSITQDFSKESRIGFAEAEKLKIEEGFVSLGGAYEEPENPHQAAISKIARQVMTRLHIQVNQTVQFYRGQQGGSAPVRLFLSGGASVMPYTAQFFSEKLNLPADAVEYFNPFRNVQIDPALNREELAKVAHSMGEVVGLGLRNLAHCPVELNLMPKSSLDRQLFNQKKPYFVSSVFCLVLMVVAMGWFYEKVAKKKEEALVELNQKVEPLQRNEQQLNTEVKKMKAAEAEADQYLTWMEDKFYWSSVLTQLREVMMAVETQQETALKAKIGVWIEKFTPLICGPAVSASTVPAGPWLPDPAAHLVNPGAPGDPNAPPPPPTSRAGKKRGGASGQATEGSLAGGEVCKILLLCRAVDMTSLAAAANGGIAYAVNAEIGARTNYFDATGTALSGTLSPDAATYTFTFEVTVKLKRPVKF